MLQQTIARPVSYTGVGLHSGLDVQLKLQPAPVDAGIRFQVHTPKGIQTILPRPCAVSATALATTLGNGKAHVSTVEHLLAALLGMGIDNVDCHVVGGEIPIMDGSAQQIVSLVEKAGIKRQYALRRVAKIRRPFSLAGDGKAIYATPYDGFYVDYTIDFPHKSIGRQHFSLDVTPETFREIAYARTFGFLQEVEYLHSKNLALGGDLGNAVVLDEEGVVNPEGLRSPDEFVRHKMLDFVGDMAMFGMPLYGRFEVSCSGHNHNNLFLRKLEAEAARYLDFVELVPNREPVTFPAFPMPVAVSV